MEDTVEIGGKMYRVRPPAPTTGPFDTQLSPEEEQAFGSWKQEFAPKDSGQDYDLRGAFKAGLKPDPKTGHWADTFKKPNHPTFSDQSQYAKDRPDLAGTWKGEEYVPPAGVVEIDGKKYRVKQPDVQRGAATPEERFAAGKPGERAALIPEMQADTQAKTAEQFERERETGEAYERVGAPLGKHTPSMEMAGGALGGLAASGAGLAGAAGGAALGGTALKAVDQLMRLKAGVPSPATGVEAAEELAGAGAKQAAYELGGRAVLGSATKAFSPMANDATRAIFGEAKKFGLPVTPEQILERGGKWNPARLMASAARAIPEDIRAMVGHGRNVREFQAGVEAPVREAAEKTLTDNLPASQSKFGTGTTYKSGVEGLLAEAKQWEKRKYDATAAFANADKNAVAAPSSLLATGRKLQRRVNQGLANPDAQKVLDRVFERIGQSKTGKLHFTELNAIRQDLGKEAFPPNVAGVPPNPNLGMLRELYHSAARDMERVPNQVLKDMARDARTVHREAVAPFQAGRGKALPNLIGKSPENYADSLTPQMIREIKAMEALHPGSPSIVPQMQRQFADEMLEAAGMDRDGGLRGRQLWGAAHTRRHVLDELHGPGYADSVKDLANAVERAQQSPRVGLGRVARLMTAPVMIWAHPIAGVSAVLGASAASAMLGTERGVRWLAEGLAPRAQGALQSKAARVGASDALRSVSAALSGNPKEREEMEKTLPQEVREQIDAQLPGPNGEPPLAKIGGQANPLDPVIAVASKKYGISPQLVKAVSHVESGERTGLVSPKGAIGPMQLMPATAMGLEVDPTDPVQNIDGGTKYLAQMMERYGGNKELALAAYNAGPDAVDRYKGIPPYPETQKYVKRVLEREQRLMGSAPPKPETPQQRQASWAEIAQRYQKAKNGKDEGEWKDLRKLINQRIKSKMQDPTLGMHPSDYRRFLPMIVEALKPEEEGASRAARG